MPSLYQRAISNQRDSKKNTKRKSPKKKSKPLQRSWHLSEDGRQLVVILKNIDVSIGVLGVKLHPSKLTIEIPVDQLENLNLEELKGIV